MNGTIPELEEVAEAVGFEPVDWPGQCYGVAKAMLEAGLVDDGPEVERETGISVEEAGATLVTGCPHCHRTFCD